MRLTAIEIGVKRDDRPMRALSRLGRLKHFEYDVMSHFS
jgi:hypothetical protein